MSLFKMILVLVLVTWLSVGPVSRQGRSSRLVPPSAGASFVLRGSEPELRGKSAQSRTLSSFDRHDFPVRDAQKEINQSRFEYTEYHMGVDVRIVAYAADRAIAERACTAAFERFAELDTILSDYRNDSELMRLCARAGGPPIHVSADLFAVLRRSYDLARRSDGAFDVTCGPLVRIWRAARKSHSLPASADIDRARRLVGWRMMELNSRARTVRLRIPGIQLDLGGIGKGYAGDCAQQTLKRFGVIRALVEAGGDIIVSAPPPGRHGWKIEVPNATVRPAPPLEFANAAISTSGDLDQSVLIGGKTYSHILNPRTGQPLTDRIQVTVIARDGLTSDGLSTAVSILGPARGRALAAGYPGTRLYIRYASGEEKPPARPHRFDGLPAASPSRRPSRFFAACAHDDLRSRTKPVIHEHNRPTRLVRVAGHLHLSRTRNRRGACSRSESGCDRSP